MTDVERDRRHRAQRLGPLRPQGMHEPVGGTPHTLAGSTNTTVNSGAIGTSAVRSPCL
jgi:hypothetical protein